MNWTQDAMYGDYETLSGGWVKAVVNTRDTPSCQRTLGVADYRKLWHGVQVVLQGFPLHYKEPTPT